MAKRNINLNTSILLQVDELFRLKKWPTKSANSGEDLYNRFCRRLSILSDEEQLLLIKLSEHFEQIPLTEYFECFWSSYFTIPENILKKASNIFFLPLLKKKKKGDKIKSSEALHYYLTSYDFHWVYFWEKFQFPNDLSFLDADFDDNSIVILVDDFIGSGKTASEAIKELRSLSVSVNSKNLFVVTLVAQELGVERVKNDTGCVVFADKKFSRGITDNVELDSKKSIVDMKKIEEKISSLIKKNGYSLGYEESEALLSLADKTPNNTFPVFWFTTQNRIPPFPRFRTSTNRRK